MHNYQHFNTRNLLLYRNGDYVNSMPNYLYRFLSSGRYLIFLLLIGSETEQMANKNDPASLQHTRAQLKDVDIVIFTGKGVDF